MTSPDTIETNPEELWKAARFVAAVGLDAVAEFFQLPFPLSISSPKDFPRPGSENRAAREGVELLRREIENAAAQLFALASALEAGVTLSPVLLIPVRPYLEAYRAAASTFAEVPFLGGPPDRPSVDVGVAGEATA
ncbi:MAG: hypothetical protein ACM338_04305 [Betaproteobacteria bacterium]